MGEKDKRCIIGEKDLKVLKLLNSYGYIKKSSFAVIFGKEEEDFQKTYIRKRLKKLEEYKYIKSYGQSYKLDIKGIEELNLNGIDIIYKVLPRSREKIIKAYKDAAIILKMNFKNKLSRIETIKYEENLGHDITTIKNFCGCAWNEEDKKYLIYRLGKLKPFQLLRDIKSDLNNSFIKRVVLVIDDLKDSEYFINKINAFKVEEFLIIENKTEHYKLLNLYINGHLKSENIFKYIDSNVKEADILFKNNIIYLNDIPILNLFILDLIKLSKEKILTRLRKTKNLYIAFGGCYEIEIFSKLIEFDEKIEFKYIRISIEKFNSFYLT